MQKKSDAPEKYQMVYKDLLRVSGTQIIPVRNLIVGQPYVDDILEDKEKIIRALKSIQVVNSFQVDTQVLGSCLIEWGCLRPTGCGLEHVSILDIRARDVEQTFDRFFSKSLSFMKSVKYLSLTGSVLHAASDFKFDLEHIAHVPDVKIEKVIFPVRQFLKGLKRPFGIRFISSTHFSNRVAAKLYSVLNFINSKDWSRNSFTTDDSEDVREWDLHISFLKT